MRYVSLSLDHPSDIKRGPTDGPLHTFAGQRPDRDAAKVTGCGLMLPSSATVYQSPTVVDIGPRCGDCFPAS